MRFLHTASAVSARFDDPNLIADAGLVPVLRLAQRCGLPELAGEAIRILGADNSGGANPARR